tara:strand:+ start:140 stop:355 length:216 start_codon:yes stop_codon:yes gene_type:complete
MKTLKDIKEKFSNGNQNAKLELKDGLVYWFNVNELRINQTINGWESNRAPLYYGNESKFYAAVSRVLRKQK